MIFLIINFILIFIAPIIFGLVILSFFRLRFYLAELFVLAYGLGTIFITFIIFISSLFGLSLSLIVNDILLSLLFIAIILVFSRRRKIISQIEKIKINLPGQWWLKTILIILIGLIIFKIAFIFIAAIERPIFQYDALAIWSLKAKIFVSNNKLILDPNHHYFLGYYASVRNYPLHLPLLESWQAIMFGNWRDGIIKIISPLYYLSLIVLLFSTLIRCLSFFKTVIFTFFLTTLPFLVYHAQHDYADVVLTFYLLVTVIYFWRGLKEGSDKYYFLGVLFAFGAAWTKNEGLFLSLIIMLSTLIYLFIKKQSKKKLFWSSLLFVALLSPWMLAKAYWHLGLDNTEGKLFLTWHPEILKIFFNHFWTTINWNIWWLIFVFTFIAFWQKIFRRENLFLFFSFFGCLAFYLCLYIFTANAEYFFAGIVDQRNLLTIVPISIFYAALLFSPESDKIKS